MTKRFKMIFAKEELEILYNALKYDIEENLETDILKAQKNLLKELKVAIKNYPR